MISLASVEVCLEGRSQLFCALALVEKTTSTLSCRRLSTVCTSTMAVVSVCLTEDAELLIVDDGRVVCVDHDNLEELVLTVFADPVGVENLEVWEVACNTLFCNALRVLCHGNLGNTSLGWLTLHVNLTLAESTTADAGTDENNTLLGLVSQAASSVETCWTLDAAAAGEMRPTPIPMAPRSRSFWRTCSTRLHSWAGRS